MQIRTGEGKSLALGGCAALFALLGFRVRCICYSKYLSQRDEKAFSALFEALQLQKRGSEQIVYSTIAEYSGSTELVNREITACKGHDDNMGVEAVSPALFPVVPHLSI